MPSSLLPDSVDAVVALLERYDYFADRRLATSVFLALKMRRPLFLEGEAGVGKTEIAKVLSHALSRSLVRLQCYEGLDTASAVYEWNYPRQMIEIRLAEAQGSVDRDALATDIFAERFLIRRPILRALSSHAGAAPVLLIDEPNAGRELAIVRRKVPGAGAKLSGEVVAFTQRLRAMDLFKAPGIAETLDWAEALVALDRIALDPETVASTLGALLKYQDDIGAVTPEVAAQLIAEARLEAAELGS